jgi:hypothetical protein
VSAVTLPPFQPPPGTSATEHQHVQQVASEMRTPQQAAVYLGCSPANVRYMAAKGELPCLRWGPQQERVFWIKDLEELRKARDVEDLLLAQRSRRRYLEASA